MVVPGLKEYQAGLDATRRRYWFRMYLCHQAFSYESCSLLAIEMWIWKWMRPVGLALP